MTIRSLLPVLGLALGCAADGLPPDAFGIFRDTNDQAFKTSINIATNQVTLFVGIREDFMQGRLSGTPPLECKAAVPEGVTALMTLQLDCGGGEIIPYTLEYRAEQGDWILTEEDRPPQRMERVRVN